MLCAGCFDDRIIVREELLPVEPKAHLVVGPLNLAGTAAPPGVVVRDGQIETGRAFYCDVTIPEMTSPSAHGNYVEVNAFPSHNTGVARCLAVEMIGRNRIMPFTFSKVVTPPLGIAGEWRAIVTVQEGPDGGHLGPARQIAEFVFQVVESESDASAK